MAPADTRSQCGAGNSNRADSIASNSFSWSPSGDENGGNPHSRIYRITPAAHTSICKLKTKANLKVRSSLLRFSRMSVRKTRLHNFYKQTRKPVRSASNESELWDRFSFLFIVNCVLRTDLRIPTYFLYIKIEFVIHSFTDWLMSSSNANFYLFKKFS